MAGFDRFVLRHRSGAVSWWLVLAILLALPPWAQGREPTRFDHDANGNLTRIVDPLGHATAIAYDPLDRPVTLTDSAGHPTQLSYDGLDHLTAVADPRGLVTHYQYDALDRLVQLESPDTGLTQLSYDAAGNLKTSIDARGLTTTFDYDAADRLIRIDSGDAGTITLGYDTASPTCADPDPANAGDRPTTMTDAAGTTDWCYDRRGRVTAQIQTTTGPYGMSLSLGYTWGSAGTDTGHLTDLIYPSGTVIHAAYAEGKAVALSIDAQPLLTAITYQPFGPVSGWIWGDGTWGPPYFRNFDLDGRLTAYAWTGTLTENGLRNVDYDAGSRITGYRHPDDPALDQSFGYDALDRLSSFQNNAETLGWSYDPTGNRTGQTGSEPFSYSVDPNSNRLLAAAGATAANYSYDAAGNLIGDGVRQYHYDGRGRLVEVEGPFGKAEYAYNGLGQRVSKVISDPAGTVTQATTFLYDEAAHLIGEYDGLTGQPVQETVYLGDLPVAVIKPTASSPAVYYVYADHLNAPRVIWNAERQAVWTWAAADPFGVALPDENPGGLGTFTYHLRFPGQYYDAETGLHHNGFRDYHPGLGRYVQSDPIGLAGGLSSYVYVKNFPISFTDPSGLESVDWQLRREALGAAGLFDAWNAARMGDQALRDAAGSGLSGAIRDSHGFGVEDGTPADAYKHCLWSCRLYRSDIPANQVSDLLRLYENAGDRGGQMATDRAMDEANNEAGRQCSAKRAPCEQACLSLLHTDELFSRSRQPMTAPVR